MEGITVGTLINMLEQLPLDLRVYVSIPHEITGVEIVEISDRHSVDWGIPKKFAQLIIGKQI